MISQEAAAMAKVLAAWELLYEVLALHPGGLPDEVYSAVRSAAVKLDAPLTEAGWLDEPRASPSQKPRVSSGEPAIVT